MRSDKKMIKYKFRYYKSDDELLMNFQALRWRGLEEADAAVASVFLFPFREHSGKWIAPHSAQTCIYFSNKLSHHVCYPGIRHLLFQSWYLRH